MCIRPTFCIIHITVGNDCVDEDIKQVIIFSVVYRWTAATWFKAYKKGAIIGPLYKCVKNCLIVYRRNLLSSYVSATLSYCRNKQWYTLLWLAVYVQRVGLYMDVRSNWRPPYMTGCCIDEAQQGRIQAGVPFFSCLLPVPSLPSPSPSFPYLPLILEIGLLKPSRVSEGQRCKFPQRGAGRSRHRKRIWCTLQLSESHRWQSFQYYRKWMFY